MRRRVESTLHHSALHRLCRIDYVVLCHQASGKTTGGLRANTQQVGGTEVYRPRFDLAGDDIGLISESLDIAHDRICKDAATLEARRVALEQHLANVAHDLRTPMASLHLVLEDLHRHIETEDGQSHLVRAIEDTTYLMVLTENLHLASKLSDGMEMMPLNVEVDLSELVERVVCLRLKGRVSRL